MNLFEDQNVKVYIWVFRTPNTKERSTQLVCHHSYLNRSQNCSRRVLIAIRRSSGIVLRLATFTLSTLVFYMEGSRWNLLIQIVETLLNAQLQKRAITVFNVKEIDAKLAQNNETPIQPHEIDKICNIYKHKGWSIIKTENLWRFQFYLNKY